MMTKTKLVIIGGVAGGASAAARARRLNEDASILLLERGPAISFANCGIPYYIGGIIQNRNRLLVQTAEAMHRRFRIEVRVNTEVLAINRTSKTLHIRDLATQTEYNESYDRLILSPGAEPIRPPLPGIELPGIFTLRSLDDMDRIQAFLSSHTKAHATVIGGGFIGVEIVEALRERGLQVSLVEMTKQVLGQLDPEMANPVHQQLKLHHVDLKLDVSVTGFSSIQDLLHVQLSSGDLLQTDLVLLVIGVKPEIKLATEAGLIIGQRGGIQVDAHMQTNDPDIFAVGDAVETLDVVGGFQAPVPLAGPANRQGRIAADNALGRTTSTYRGSQGTSICKVFNLTVASTGLNEKNLKRLNRPFQKIYVHPASHASYYPGAQTMSLKLLFQPIDGKILGAQIVGSEGVDKRMDVLATALRGGLTVFDLEHLELCYAPPYGSAKDPVNYAGFVAANGLRQDVTFCYAEDISQISDNQVLLDVRTTSEVASGTIPGAINIPLDLLRQRLAELPANKELIIFCQVGLRSYLAARILTQRGWKTKVITGGYTTYQAVTNLYSPLLY